MKINDCILVVKELFALGNFESGREDEKEASHKSDVPTQPLIDFCLGKHYKKWIWAINGINH